MPWAAGAPRGSGHAREHRRSRCHAPRWILRGRARSHRYGAFLGLPEHPVGAALAANTGAAGAMYRVGFFAGAPAPTGYADRLRIQFSKPQHSRLHKVRNNPRRFQDAPGRSHAIPGRHKCHACRMPRTSARRRAAAGKEAAGTTQP
ncbi:protein of unknown function [Pseudomonas sp. JV551A1]|uniref:Uncharacterized protein n=1 Tax=Pseudomonas inefficax TaxID=2078786 RepID=A0AAQ1P8Z6_9PSED|nr:protein of unknown function [Pseudomonas sp. JV551A1]SPO59975.1 protein of unknown function [Pseudomonas inefficax]